MKILCCAQLKDATGEAEIDWSVPKPVTSDELWQRLLAQYPRLAPHRPVVRLARNWEYAPRDAVFEDNDEVALIPPVSGG
jgi:molybdopterin converting factor small subunit